MDCCIKGLNFRAVAKNLNQIALKNKICPKVAKFAKKLPSNLWLTLRRILGNTHKSFDSSPDDAREERKRKQKNLFPSLAGPPFQSLHSHTQKQPTLLLYRLLSWGLRARAGGGALARAPALFGKKLRNTHFQIKGIFDGIRIFVSRTKLWLVHLNPISSVLSLKTKPHLAVHFCVFTSQVM